MSMVLDEVTFGGDFRIAQLRYAREEGGFYRECRRPGDDISDLPEEVRKQIEAEWTPEVVQALADAEAAAAEASANQPVLIPYGKFRARWTDEELAGLFSVRKTTWQVDDYITLASGQGHVNLSGPTAAAAKALFVQLGVLSVDRADVIFAAD